MRTLRRQTAIGVLESLQRSAPTVAATPLTGGPEGPEGKEGKEGKQGPEGKTGATGAAGPTSGGLILARAATTAALATNTLTGIVLEATANGALASQDGVALAVGDRLLVKNEAEGKKNGVYEVTSLGAAGSKWKLTRISSMDESSEVAPGMLISVAEGTRNKRRVFSLTTTGAITLGTTALAFAAEMPRDFGIVEALPTSEAIIGDLCSFKAAAGIYWQLVYTEEATYPWAYIGGAPLQVEDETGRVKEGTTYTAIAGTMEMTLPLKGIYDMEFGGRFYSSTVGAACGTALGYNGTVEETFRIDTYNGAAASGAGADSRRHRKELTTAAVAVKMFHTINSGTVFNMERRWAAATPVRVG